MLKDPLSFGRVFFVYLAFDLQTFLFALYFKGCS